MKKQAASVLVMVLVLGCAALLAAAGIHGFLNNRRADDGYHYGYAIVTDKGFFFEAKQDYGFFSKGDLVKVNYLYLPDGTFIEFPTDGLSTGDEIRMVINRTGDSLPPVAMVEDFEKVSSGSVDRISPEIQKRLQDDGFNILKAKIEETAEEDSSLHSGQGTGGQAGEDASVRQLAQAVYPPLSL